MRRKKLLLTALTCILIGSVGATSIAEENVSVDLEDERVTATLDIEELTSSSFNYITNHPVREMEVEINDRPVECDFEDMTLGGEIRCPTDLRENFTVTMNYRTSGLKRSVNGVNIFRYSQSIYRPIEEYNFRVSLPEGTGIIDQENVSTPVIEPSGGDVGSEGRRIHVEWTDQPSLGDTMSYQVTYEQLSPDYSNVVIGITVLVLAVGLYRFYLRQKSRSKSRDIMDSLTEDEREVFEILIEEEDMLQKDIVDASEYSKAKISGVISSLEDEGLIIKEKEGRSNRIYVKEEFLD
jgi:DNA-binding transcriptional ArsR family regulator